MAWMIVVAALCVSLAIFPACGGGGGGGGTPIPLKNPGDFIEQTIGDLDTLDPSWHYDTASAEQIYYMYDTLVFYDGTSTDTFVPGLATSWSFAPNGTQFRATIRSGVKFWNNETLTPEDVEYTFERAMIQDRAGGPTWMFNGPIAGVARSRSAGVPRPWWCEYVQNAIYVEGGDVVIDFNSSYPSIPWLQIIGNTFGAVINMDWCVAKGDWSPNYTANWTAYNNPASKSDTVLFDEAMGTGPWMLDVWNPGVQIKLVKNADYWQGTPPFNNVITQVVDEWTSRKLALLAGDADLVYVPKPYINEVINVTDLLKISGLPELTVDAFFMNMDIGVNSTYIGSKALDGNGIPSNFFTDRDVRLGFVYSFDYDTYMTDVMMDEGTMMASPIIQGLFGYDAGEPRYALCLTKATQHFQAAWGGALWTNGFKMTLCYNTGNVPRKTACEMLAETMGDINPLFQISILPIAWDTYLDLLFTPSGITDLPMFQIGWQCDYPDPDNFVDPFMGTVGAFSDYQGYGNSTIDDLIVAGRYMNNNATRQAIYDQLEDIYVYDVPGIMLAQPEGRRWFTKYIHGFYFNPTIPGLPGPLFDMTKS
jgi:peptide/nickel transport system substrate-binding protein